MHPLRFRTLVSAIPLLLATPALVLAQQPIQVPTRAEATAALNPAASAYTRQQLDQMLAPIALYPDQLLMQVLMAATFPTQIVDAGQWLQDPNNVALKGDQLVAALEPLPWDPSVKSLVAYPQIIVMLNEHLDWTEALGIAFANQQVLTMSRVQFLRERAVAAGKLTSTPQIRIVHQGPDIVIEPSDPDMLYVPVYNPADVYGTWPDSGYPPVYIPPSPDYYAGAIGVGIGFGVGIGIIHSYWGWGHPDWRRHEVVVDRNLYGRITRSDEDARNHVVIRNDTWRRTAPVAQVPVADRPHPSRGGAPQPAGTVTSAAVRVPKPPASVAPNAPPTVLHRTTPAVAHPPGTPEPLHPEEKAVVHPPGTPPGPPHPEEKAVVHPPGTPPGPPHPEERAVVHPPGTPPGPLNPEEKAVVHPPGAPPGPLHPEEKAVVHPPGAPPGPPHPEERAVVHPPGPPPAPPHPEEKAVVHPPVAPPPHPEERAVVHPPGPPPAPHPVAPVVVRPPAPPPAAPHPAPPAPVVAHPAPPPVAHPPAPEKKAPPEPGTEEHH